MHSKKKTQDKGDFSQEKIDNTVAFVLCHPFDSCLAPIIGELPPCLFPVCNSPVLLYVLNWLSVNEISKIYILCRSADKKVISKVTNECAQRMLMENIKIVDTDESIYNMGDCFRFIDKWNQQYNEFQTCIVVPGTLITNVQLKTVLEEHKKRGGYKKEDLQPVLTTVFTQSSTDGYTIVENSDSMILKLQPSSDFEFGVSPLPLMIEPSYFKHNKQIRVRSCLKDAQIYVCSAQLFLDFGESFDWKTVADDCIPTQIRLLDLTRHISHLSYKPDAYAQTIDDLPSYINASLAVIRRWLYPVTVEMNFFAPQVTDSVLTFDMDDVDESCKCQFVSDSPLPDESTEYRLKRDLVYLYANVFPSLTAKIGHSVVIGNGTELKDDCIVRNSVIGSCCTIGKGAIIENCIIWDRVNIGDGVHMKHCIVASDVDVKDGITISFGCVISFQCVVDSDLPPCRRLTTQPGLYPDGLFHSNDPMGTESLYPWLDAYIESKEEVYPQNNQNTHEFFVEPKQDLPQLRLWFELSHSDFPIDLDDVFNEQSAQIIEFDEDGKDDMEPEGSEDDNFVQLDAEYQASAKALFTAIMESEKIDINQFRTEFIALKNTKNASHLDCATAIILAVCEHYDPSEIEGALDTFVQFLYDFLQDREDQEDFLFWWQGYCAKDVSNKDMYISVLKKLIDDDIVEEASVESWKEQQDDCTERQKALFEAYIDSN